MLEKHPALTSTFKGNFCEFSIMDGGFLTATANKIIMGTFPPPKSKLLIQGDDYFFYPSNRNQFWNIVDTINKSKRLDIEKLKFSTKSFENFRENIYRKAKFSQEQNWAFLDFYVQVKRRVLNSSKDIDLVDKGNIIENETLYCYLKINPNINQISCTYQTAFNNLLLGLKNDNYDITESSTTEKIFIYQQRKILINLLPPPTRSRIKLDERVLRYSNSLYN